MKITTSFLLMITVLALATVSHAQTLRGSRSSMEQQHGHAVTHGYQFAHTSRDVDDMIQLGTLQRVRPTPTMAIHNVSYPYLQPSVKTLVERLSAQYYNACGEKMTVTSMTRPIARQPSNAATDSVHPTGMAFDLRVPSNSRCRRWLEQTLLSLESSQVLDVTRERRPPHYHVATFPEPYQAYLASILGHSHDYEVRSGDTLVAIAARSNVTVNQLRAANSIRGDLIRVGQVLTIPGESSAQVTAVAAQESPVSQPTELEHQVRRGETLWRIANRYRTSVDALRSQNGLAGDMLKVGQVLKVVVD